MRRTNVSHSETPAFIETANGKAKLKVGRDPNCTLRVVIADDDALALGIREYLLLTAFNDTFCLDYVEVGYGNRRVFAAGPVARDFTSVHALPDPVGAAMAILCSDLKHRAETDASRVVDLTARLRVRDAELRAEKAARDLAGYDLFRHA